ncbi:MAG: PAS domain-containing protein [Pegethrix bostrychoides GSE-TBD4-15B]|jgi:PAS domain S-box-containing protein|uniref:Circadian input-output histidine kinase CikA n=1 Tax=Pegethrix bostrychoides GSE-TBD4-15B TaxID=2839662 RepID=A0A951U3X7_9CYAN|nr:PAS domain-containing protein [Pegethrix bostrychoides GSE-TBD4-15B]
MKLWKNSLIVQLVGYFLLLSFVTVSSICSVAFWQARAALEDSIIKQLDLTADLKEDELNRWIEDQREEVNTLIRMPEVIELAPLMLQAQPDPSAAAQLTTALKAIADNHSSIDEILLLTKGGRVVTSTRQPSQNTYESLVQYSYLPENGNPFYPNFYLSLLSGRPRMTFASPLLDGKRQIGVLAIHLNLDRIDEVIRKRPGLGNTGETYLVGNTLPNQSGSDLELYNIFVSGGQSSGQSSSQSSSQSGHSTDAQAVRSEGIAQAARGREGSGIYHNYRGVEVIGAYRWLDKNDLALLAEMTTQEAFAPARKLAQTLFASGLGLAGLLAVGVYFGTRRIARPILAITQTAAQVAAGDLTSTAPVLSENEIGSLARVFNQMIEQLRLLYADLESQVKQRTAALTQSNEQLQSEIGERLRAEETLQQQQQFLRTVIDTDPSLIFVKDWEGRYLLANQATADFYQLSVEELVGKSDRDLHPDIAAVEGFVEQNQQVIETGQGLFIAEEQVSTLTHQNQWLQWQKQPLQLPGSSVNSVLGIGVSITERKRLEEELRTSQQFLDSIISSIPLAIVVKDVKNDFRYVLINQNSEKVLGFPVAEAIGRNDYELISNARADYHRQEDLATLQAGKLLEFPEHWTSDAPDRIMIRGWKMPLFDAEGNATHIVMIAEDITERQHREQALRLIVEGTAAQTGDEFFHACVRYLAKVLRVRYACLTEAVDAARTRVRTIAFWQGKADAEDFSENFAEDFSENSEYSVEASPCGSVLKGQVCYFPQGLSAAFPSALSELGVVAESYLGVPLINSAGQILGHLAVLDEQPMEHDPGRELILKIFAARAGAELERQQAEASLRLAKEAAEAANRAKSAFLANMSHELRTPLNAILGFAHLMERDPALTPKQRESLSTINHSGEHLLNLINDVLEMSKIEAGRILLNQAPCDLYQLLQTLKALFQPRTQAKQLSLQFDIPTDLPESIITDEGKLRQVLINLLGNAVKFTEAGGVSLRVWQEYQMDMIHLQFEITDTGCGIAAEELGQIFQPFMQTLAGAQFSEGTGLGLAISRQFVRLMGGEIRVESVFAQGSTFRFHLPVQVAEPVLPPLTTQRVLHLAPDQPSYRILVVDDRLENRDLLVQLLNVAGFETRTAATGLEAIAKWQTWQPHLIWMDMRMPGIDGYEATRQIRAAAGSETTKIIALTASAFEEQQETILAAGCDDLVRKPFQEAIIFDKMAEHLGLRYLYEEQLISGAPVTLTTDMLAMMPADWIAQLHQAALYTDEPEIISLIEKIPDSHTAMKNTLINWVNNFRCDKILDLTKR